MTRLSDYGLPLFSYSGRGTVEYEGGVVRAVDFDAGQTSDGCVRVLVSATDASVAEIMEAMLERRDSLRFSGQSNIGERLTSSGVVWSDDFLPETSVQGFYDALRVTRLRVERDSAAPIREYRFGLANATLCGVKRLSYVTDGTPISCSGLPLKLPIAEGVLLDAMLVPTPNSERRTFAVIALRGIDVLSELIVLVQSPIDRKEIEQAVNDVCYVLSVARGSKVNWVYCEERDVEGRLVARVHRAAVTKDYSPCAPIDETPRFREETVVLLTDGLTAYRTRREQLRLDRGVIDAYLDAKAEADFLETRGAKMAVALEMLKSAFLKRPGPRRAEYVLSQEAFASLLPSLESAVDATLKRAGIAEDARKAMGGRGKLRALNRCSFRSVLAKLFRDVDFDPPTIDVRLFLASRNKLVHEGCFYTDCAEVEERAELEPLADGTTEFLFLVSFLDRLFLRILNYRGRYRDFRLFQMDDDVREL